MEIIILDDCSTDESLFIISKYLKYPQIRVVRNDTNSGSTFLQWQKGIELAKAELIWIAESDDFSSSDFLASIITKFIDPNVVLSYSNSYIIDENSKIVNNVFSILNPELVKEFNHSFKMNGLHFLSNYLLHFNVIPNASSVVFKKIEYLNVCNSNFNLTRTGDWLLWMKLATKGNIAYDASFKNYFRIHQKSVTAKKEEHVYKYGLQTRELFSEFLNQNKTIQLLGIIEKNNYYISLDRGERGLMNLKNNNIIQGFKDIFFATFTPRFKSFYIKKAFAICTRF